MNFGFGKNEADKTEKAGQEKQYSGGFKISEDKKNEKAEVYLGAGSTIEGEFKFAGPTFVNCTLKGNVTADAEFTLGPSGEVTGNVKGTEVTISGKVTGNVTGSKFITLAKPAEVSGDLDAPKISIGDGVIFNGSCAMKAPAEIVDLKRPAHI